MGTMRQTIRLCEAKAVDLRALAEVLEEAVRQADPVRGAWDAVSARVRGRTIAVTATWEAPPRGELRGTYAFEVAVTPRALACDQVDWEVALPDPVDRRIGRDLRDTPPDRGDLLDGSVRVRVRPLAVPPGGLAPAWEDPKWGPDLDRWVAAVIAAAADAVEAVLLADGDRW